MTIKVDIPAGYTESFKVKCTQHDGTAITSLNTITITQSAINCFTGIADQNYADQVIPYGGSLTIDVTNFFQNQYPIGCPISNCYLKQGTTCATSDLDETRVTMGTTSPWTISYTNTESDGVLLNTCFVCTATNGVDNTQMIKSQLWKLTQQTRCLETELPGAIFTQAQYDTTGTCLQTNCPIRFKADTKLVVTAEFKDIFNSQSAPCDGVARTCEFRTAGGCSSTYTSTHLQILDLARQKINAAQNNPLGYSEKFCYRCFYGFAGQYKDFDNVHVRQLPDCQGQITPKTGLTITRDYLFNSVGVWQTVDTTGLNYFFNNPFPVDCPLLTYDTLNAANCKGGGFASAQFQVVGNNVQMMLDDIAGYTTSICMEASGTDASGGNYKIQFTTFTVVQNPPDCSQLIGPADSVLADQILTYDAAFTSGSPFNLGVGFTSFFKTTDSVICPISSCTLYDTTCATIAAWPEVQMDTLSPFQITVQRDVLAGYSYQACLKCQTPSLQFVSHQMTITQAHDCTQFLSASSTSTLSMQYNKLVVNNIVPSSHSLFILNSDTAKCPLSSCALFNPSCANPFVPSAGITIEMSQSGTITATQNTPLGYSQTLCLKCEYSNSVLPSLKTPFQRQITLTQSPVCQTNQIIEPADIILPDQTYDYDEQKQDWEPIGQGFYSFFKSTCPFNSCQLLNPSCNEPLSSTTVMLDTFEPWQLKVKINEFNGYQQKMCIKCTIANLQSLTHLFTFKQNQSPCRIAVSALNVNKETQIAFNENVARVNAVSGTSQFFYNTEPTQCPIENCQLRQSGNCNLNYSPAYVTLETTSPFRVTAPQNFKEGYSETFCYYCSLSNGNAFIQFDQFTVQQLPDLSPCKDQLALQDVIRPHDRFYNFTENQTSPIEISYGFSQFFYTLKPQDCPIFSCQILESNCITNFTSNSNIFMEELSPWRIYAYTNVTYGYNSMLCLRCDSNNQSINTSFLVTQTAYVPPPPVIVYNLTVEPEPIIPANITVNVTVPQNFTFNNKTFNFTDFNITEEEMVNFTVTKLPVKKTSQPKYPEFITSQRTAKQSQNSQEVNDFFDAWWLLQLNKKREIKDVKGDPVQLYVKDITPSGLVTIRFNQELVVPFFVWNANKRLLESKKFSLDQIDVQENIMKIYVVINSERDIKLNYTVELKSWTKYEMKVFLNFTDPLLVSAGMRPDMLVIDVVNPYLFTSQLSGQWLQQDREVIDAKIKKQFAKDYNSKPVDSTAVLIDSVAKSFALGQLIAQIFLKGSIEEIISLYYTLQIICYTDKIYNFFIPSSATNFLDILLNLIEFSVLKPEPLIQMIDEDFSLSDYLQSDGDQDGLMNQMQLYIMAAILMTILSVIIIIIGYWKRQLVKKLWDKIVEIMIYNGIIRSYQMSYLKFLVNPTEHILQGHDSTSSVAMMVITLLGAVYITCFLCYNKFSVNHKRWGNLVKDVHIRQYHTYWDFFMFSWLYLPFFLLRRLIFVLIPLVITHSAFQLMFMIGFSVASLLVYVHTRPHISYRRQFIEIVNELFILGFIYHLIAFSDFNTSLDSKFQMGVCNTYFLGILVAVNLINMIISLVQSYDRHKRIKARKQQLQQQKYKIEEPESSSSASEQEEEEKIEPVPITRESTEEKPKEKKEVRFDEANMVTTKVKSSIIQQKKTAPLQQKNEERQKQINKAYFGSTDANIDRLKAKLYPPVKLQGTKKKYSGRLGKKTILIEDQKGVETSIQTPKFQDVPNVIDIIQPIKRDTEPISIIMPPMENVKESVSEQPKRKKKPTTLLTKKANFLSKAQKFQKSQPKKKIKLPSVTTDRAPEELSQFMMVGGEPIVIDKRQVKMRESKAQIIEEIDRLKKEQVDEDLYDSEHIKNIRKSLLLILNEQLQQFN